MQRHGTQRIHCRTQLCTDVRTLARSRDVPGGAPQFGSSLQPIRYWSTARAACRPSRMAQTISDWPRRMSPAAKTLSTLVL